MAKYKPYDNWKSFDIVEKNQKKFLSIYEYMLEIDESNYIPKAGLLFDEILKNKCCDKKVLDIGCGQLGILGLIAMHYGAKELVSVDLDTNCINWLKKIINDNNIKNVTAVEGNLFSDLIEESKYDLILSNPPHMPMKKGKMCDSGGIDGKLYITKILDDAIQYLNDEGELLLMMFDFLGADKSYNDKETVFDYAKKIGYKDMEIIFEFKKNITKGSVTFENLDYIKTIYPNYIFDKENPECNLIICKFKK